MTLPLRTDNVRTTPPGGERGIVLIYALVGLMIVIGLILAAGERGEAVRVLARVEFEAGARAKKAAESGLVDALSWLRAQYEQPVPAIAPRRDMDVDPPIDETDDATLGLVREFEIARGYWARYVVHSGVPDEPFVDRNGNGIYDDRDPFTDLNGDGVRTMGHGCRDMSFARGAVKPGIVWYLESEGSVYRRLDADLPLGEGRNARLAHVVLGTEVRRVSYLLPTSAAIVVGRAADILLEGTVIESPALGIAYRPDSGTPKYKVNMADKKHSELKTPVEHAPVSGWSTGVKDEFGITCQDVFGVSMQTLRSMADYSVQLVKKIPTKGVKLEDFLLGGMVLDNLPITIPEDTLTVITPAGGTLTVDKGESLIGRGIVVIDGNLDVKADTLTNFTGILFVSGDMTVSYAGAFEGIVIVGGRLQVVGELPTFKVKRKSRKKKSMKSRKSFKKKKSTKALKWKPERSVWFGHSPEVVEELIAKIGNYRKFKASYVPPHITPDGRPDEAFATSASLMLPGAK